MADVEITMDRTGRRSATVILEDKSGEGGPDDRVPVNGGTADITYPNPLPDITAPPPGFVPPMISVVPQDEFGVQWYITPGAVQNPDGTVTLTLVNHTPGGAGEKGSYEVTLWFPHTSVR